MYIYVLFVYYILISVYKVYIIYYVYAYIYLSIYLSVYATLDISDAATVMDKVYQVSSSFRVE